MKNPNWVLGIDFETTGLVPENDKDVIIEVGAVLWDWAYDKPVAMISETVILEDGRELRKEIQDLTGITPIMVQAPIAKPEAAVLGDIFRLASVASAYMAHNAKFDRAFLEAAAARNFLDIPKLPWLCSIADIPYPAKFKARQLSHLAADHGFLSPWSHRAVFDVLTMFSTTKHYTLEAIKEFAASPTVRLIGKFPQSQNDAGKANGFRWDPDCRQWYREVKKCQMPTLKIDVAYIELGTISAAGVW